jgi:hypothetical protein
MCLPADRFHQFLQGDAIGRFNESRILAVLMPRRAGAAFLALEALRAGSALERLARGPFGSPRLHSRLRGPSFGSFGIEVVIWSGLLFAARCRRAPHESLRSPPKAS